MAGCQKASGCCGVSLAKSQRCYASREAGAREAAEAISSEEGNWEGGAAGGAARINELAACARRPLRLDQYFQ